MTAEQRADSVAHELEERGLLDARTDVPERLIAAAIRDAVNEKLEAIADWWPQGDFTQGEIQEYLRSFKLPPPATTPAGKESGDE